MIFKWANTGVSVTVILKLILTQLSLINKCIKRFGYMMWIFDAVIDGWLYYHCPLKLFRNNKTM